MVYFRVGKETGGFTNCSSEWYLDMQAVSSKLAAFEQRYDRTLPHHEPVIDSWYQPKHYLTGITDRGRYAHYYKLLRQVDRFYSSLTIRRRNDSRTEAFNVNISIMTTRRYEFKGN